MSDKPQVTFKYIFTYDYNPAYVNGAHGGVSPRGDLVVNFYLERPPLPNEITHEINPNGTVGAETAVEPDDFAQSLVRFVPSGIVLNHQTARELHHWLGEKVREMEAIEQHKSAMRTQQGEGDGPAH
ncbi:hypothetical protein GeomeDRAFT_0223 [Geobacter metallireducens RCH3]|uniref:Uncharacterized protein n=1 Tax=Geobacter metallireducens (strain ATCC 53774 / DSM 7210 / GS-15) TaxID=269799 RepID=Q39VM4_GEOMG|nr:hypothetical protein [Geobacter metallireducens]ABB31700.1 hypothetical protein Gmet_1466 [Geobacter metallireducens GS-15]EHP89425.1 hypothetical protein GeomeDRAFT_0223 [Geobacter metallireducens RCH3]MBT1076751.1 hypothetical protein [Geobacter grbiciae]